MTTSRRHATLATLVGSGANTLIVSIQAVLLIPLYLNAVGPRLYGAWLGSGDILVWMQALDLGLPNLMIQRIGAAYGKGESNTVVEYFATGMAVLALIALLVSVAAGLFSTLLPELMRLTGDEAYVLRTCFLIGAISASLNILNNGVVGFSRGIQDTKFMTQVQIISSVFGFAVSLGLVLTGWGLWSIAFGLLARIVVSLLGSAIFAGQKLKREFIRPFRFRYQIFRELILVSPSTAIGGIGYAAMNQSESAIVAVMIGPEMAAVFTLTRKVLDVARGLVDMIAFASYGGFAHLVTSKQRERTLEVHREINSLRLSLAIVLASAYMAVNRNLIEMWVGIGQYGGVLLTILMALQFVLVGGSFLLNYLYRAIGRVMRGSLALAVESTIRVPLMFVLLLWLGLPGIPLAGILTASVFAWLAYRWTVDEVLPYSRPLSHLPLRVWYARALIFSIGAILCLVGSWQGWIPSLLVGSSLATIGIVVLFFVDPSLRAVVMPFVSTLACARLLGQRPVSPR